MSRDNNEFDYFDKKIYTKNEMPWIDYIEIDEETGERKLRDDTPDEIVKMHNDFLQEKHEFIENNILDESLKKEELKIDEKPQGYNDIKLNESNYETNHLNNSKSREVFNDFIPYKQIGPFKLDKIDEKSFEQNGIDCLYEYEFNQVMCRPSSLDYEPTIKRLGEPIKIFIKYNNHIIKITCYFDRFINNLKTVCNDIVIDETIEDNKTYIYAYSKELGITIQSIDNIIYYLYFDGKDAFNNNLKRHLNSMK